MLPSRATEEWRALRQFLTDEWRSPVRLSQPRLVARGYLSDRRWFYPTPPSRAAGYLSDYGYRRVVSTMNPPAIQRLFADKTAFDRAMADNGLGDRTPQLLATVVDGVVTRHRAWSGPVARKPNGGAGGRGFGLFATLDEALSSCPPRGGFLVQERVVAHPYGAEIFPGSLNTLRVFALRDAPGQPARVPVAVQRIGRLATAPLDSFSAGGLLARVELQTGELSAAVGPVVRRSRDSWDAHPDTGARIAGRVVPRLDEALDLVRRAMDAFPEALHIGWDIAVSERGPLVIEGNASWTAIRSVQAHGPFADGPVCRAFYQRWGLLPRARA